MNRLLLLALTLGALPLTACMGGDRASGGVCPDGEVCSPATPNGLDFRGTAISDGLFENIVGPRTVAVGGTSVISLAEHTAQTPLSLPFDAAVADPGVLAVASTDPGTGSLVVRATGAGQTYLRVLDPADHTLYDRKLLDAAPIERTELVLEPTSPERVPLHTQFAIQPSRRDLYVGLWGTVSSVGQPVENRLVDAAMTITPPAGSAIASWDQVTVAKLPLGHHPLLVAAGGRAAVDLDLLVAEPADVQSIALQPVDPVVGGACFSALVEDRHLLGLTWTFTVDGAAPAAARGNCVSLGTTPRTAHVTATAAGKTVAVDIVTDGTRRGARPGHTRVIFGDRAQGVLSE